MSKYTAKKEVMKNDLLDNKQIRKKQNKTYQKCFRNLSPRTIYWDPMGMKTNGQPIDMKKEWYEAEKEILEHFDYLHAQKDFSVNDSIEQIRKNVVETGAWNLPTYYLPDMRIINPERSPLADMLPRVATDEKKFDVAARTTQNETDVGWGIEPSSGDSPTNFSAMRYPYASLEGDVDNYTYTMKQYGLADTLSDFMQLASRTIRDSRQAVEDNLARSIRLAEEYQIVLGTNFDGSGFNGIPDLGTEYDSSTAKTGVGISTMRSLIDKCVENGADASNLMVVTNFDTHKNLRGAMDDYVRYEAPGSGDLNFGSRTFMFDDVPVFRSHAMNNSTSTIHTACLSADSTYLAMMQDLNIDPLAKLGPQEDIAMTAIGTLVSETGDGSTRTSDHIQYISAS